MAQWAERRHGLQRPQHGVRDSWRVGGDRSTCPDCFNTLLYVPSKTHMRHAPNTPTNATNFATTDRAGALRVADPVHPAELRRKLVFHRTAAIYPTYIFAQSHDMHIRGSAVAKIAASGTARSTTPLSSTSASLRRPRCRGQDGRRLWLHRADDDTAVIASAGGSTQPCWRRQQPWVFFSSRP